MRRFAEDLIVARQPGTKLVTGDIVARTFDSEMIPLLLTDLIAPALQTHSNNISDRVDRLIRDGSGWAVHEIISVSINITRYNPLAGNSWMELPKPIRHKTYALLNIKNMNDDRCLEWALVAALERQRGFPRGNNRLRVGRYQKSSVKINMTGISTPTPISEIGKVEKLNDVSINVFGWDDGTILKGEPSKLNQGFYPIRLCQNPNSETCINILLGENDRTSHWVWIQDLSALLCGQSKNTHAKFCCVRCLRGFTRSDLLDNHERDCSKLQAQRTIMPDEVKQRDYPVGSIKQKKTTKEQLTLKFNSWRKTIKHPFTISADIECILVPREVDENGATVKISEHIPCTVSYKLNSHLAGFEDEAVVIFHGPKCVDEFLEALDLLYERLRPWMEMNEPMEKVDQATMDRLNAYPNCVICKRKLIEDKHLDHCHYTGKVLGYTHPLCNLERQTPKYLPIFFHNLKGYDSHMVIGGIADRVDDPWDINVIAKAMETYTAFSTKKFRFIDSCAHLNSSLEKLVSNLHSSGPGAFKPVEDFLQQKFGSVQPEKLRGVPLLLLQDLRDL
ncbi:uncharacterized protein LOC134823687 [Bolinopsis microptera]|uniref:uncharacterized protein LOC134823687 n=1 Tax=Bolinopsis microptera TaxID=2820187 RepID=UPI0030796BE5